MKVSIVILVFFLVSFSEEANSSTRGIVTVEMKNSSSQVIQATTTLWKHESEADPDHYNWEFSFEIKNCTNEHGINIGETLADLEKKFDMTQDYTVTVIEAPEGASYEGWQGQKFTKNGRNEHVGDRHLQFTKETLRSIKL